MYNVGDVIEYSFGRKVERYLVTAVGVFGYIELRKVMLGKTKISNVRFPPTITIRKIANTRSDKP